MTPQVVCHTLKAVMGPFIKARSRSLQAFLSSGGLLPISRYPQDIPDRNNIHCQQAYTLTATIMVLSSIAKWSSVDFYNPLHNQLNGECQSLPTVQHGDWLEWKLPKLLPLWVKSAWQIDGSILRVFLVKSFSKLYLMLMVRATSEDYSQREEARLLGVSQGCISKILRCNWDTGRQHQRRRWGRRSLTTDRENRQLIRMVRDNGFISAPRLCVDMIRRFRRSLSVRSIVNRLWLLAIGIKVLPCASYWLWITGDAAMCGAEPTEHGAPGTGATVSSVASLASCCFTVMVALVHAAGKVDGSI